MPVLNVPRDERWGELGAGLGNLLGSAVNRVEELRVMKGVSDVQQDPTVPEDQKYNAIASKYGAQGISAYQNMERARLVQEQLRGIQEERQAGALAFQGLMATPAGAALGVPQAGLPGVTRAPAAPIGPAIGPASAVRGSWFGNAPGWVDPSDSGLQASGKPVSAGPGIALPSRATLGQDFDVTAPSGQTYRLKQTDVGPAARTGRGVDINAPAAQLMGYTPKTFPTDAGFKVSPADKSQVRANDIAQDALEGITAAQYGAVQRKQLAEAIEKANPDAPAYVKMQAFERASKVLAPEERQAWELEKVRMNADLRVSLAELRGFQQAQAIQQRGDIQEHLLRQRQDQREKGVFSDAEASYWADYLKTVGSLPAGISRSTAAVRQIMGKAADVGGDPRKMAENLSTFKADQHSLSRATTLADAATSFEATALKNLDTASRELGKAAPTNLGPWLNKWIETGETQSGNKQVPASVAAVLTFANEYAKVMSGAVGAQGATVNARQEAAELFSPYFNAGQWDEVARIARTDMANRKAALYEQVDAIRGRIREGGTGAPSTELMGKAQPETPPVRASDQGRKAQTIPQEAIDMLKANPAPEQRANFDDVFGKGAADRVLK